MKSPNFIITMVILVFTMCTSSLMAQYTETTLSNGTKKGFLAGYSPQGQQQDNWCWAASGTMTMGYVKSSDAPNQCTQATATHGGDCCNPTSASGSPCNQGATVSEINANYARYGYSIQTKSSALTFEEIKETLKSNSPIGFTWLWSGGGGHMMTAFGWAESTSGQQWVLIADPLPARSSKGTVKCITYEAYVSKAGRYSHYWDWYNITK